jgi:hypothetical protein
LTRTTEGGKRSPTAEGGAGVPSSRRRLSTPGKLTPLISLRSRREHERFRTYAKIGAAFVTGWAVSKVDRVLDLYLDPARGPLILEPLIGHRVLTGMTAFILAMVTTYVARKYVSFGPGAENPPQRQGALEE